MNQHADKLVLKKHINLGEPASSTVELNGDKLEAELAENDTQVSTQRSPCNSQLTNFQCLSEHFGTGVSSKPPPF